MAAEKITKKHALILGSGLYAKKVGTILAKSPEFCQLTIASRNLSNAQKLTEELSSKSNIRISAKQVDASEQKQLMRLFADADLVVNLTDPIELTAIPAIRSAIESGLPYVDINIDIGSLREAFKLDSKARSAQVSILTGFGYDPGLINILAKHGMSQIDEVEEIHFAGGGQGPLARYPERGIRVTLDTHAAPYVYKDGAFVDIPPYSGIEIISLADTEITREVMAAVHAPLAMIPLSFPDIKVVTYKSGTSPAEWGNDIIRNFAKLGLLDKEPIQTSIGMISPFNFTVSFLCSPPHAKAAGYSGPVFPFVSLRQVKVVGKKGNDKVMYKVVCRDPGYATTENTCALATIMLAQDEIKLNGVIFPEMLDPEPFINWAEQGGLIISEYVIQC